MGKKSKVRHRGHKFNFCCLSESSPCSKYKTSAGSEWNSHNDLHFAEGYKAKNDVTFVSVQNEQFSRCSWMERGWQKSRPMRGALTLLLVPTGRYKTQDGVRPLPAALRSWLFAALKRFLASKREELFSCESPVCVTMAWLKKNVKHVLCVFHWPPHVSSTSPAVGRKEAKKRKTLRPEGVA